MVQPISTHEPAVAAPPSRDVVRSAVICGGAGLGAMLLVAALALWFHYGTAVFFETIASGIAGCF